MLKINEPAQHRIALHHLGFRPFFLLAGAAGVILMGLWFWLYQSHPVLPGNVKLATPIWHAHEMIYGYSMAVIAGFLLTAVHNWTGQQTLNGTALLLLALLWLLARCMPFTDQPFAPIIMASLDMSFGVGLCLALLYPIVKVRQWTQLGVFSKALLLVVANGMFYLGMFGQLDTGLYWGLFGGLYLIVSLVLMMGRRVLPFFIEKGVSEPVTLVNRRWLDIASLILMLVFLVVEVLLPQPGLAAATAWALFVLHTIRLAGWYTPGIWRKPLLWVLYAGYGWLVAGFALRGLQAFLPLNPNLALHAFAVGGIGMMTLGMMARVALGHTGRNVFDPPAILRWLFLCLLSAAAIRVLLPIALPQQYGVWVGLSQMLWIAAFAGFTWIYAPMLVRARIDGRYG